MRSVFFVLLAPMLVGQLAWANVPGGGTNGANVTLTDAGSTVTLANGIVSIVCTKSGGTINQINYTFNNGGGNKTLNLLAGGNNGGQLYWENSNNQGLSFVYAVVSDPANNGGNYAEIQLTTTSVANDVLEIHYSLLRGATGFYVTAIWSHRSIDGAFGMGECRDNIYAGSIFNWMSVDATRNRLMEVSGGAAIGVLGAPVEVSLWTNGIYAGQYEDKYKYSADLGLQRLWGWSSVGTGGKNIGLWNISASAEYYNGGPLKRELMEHIGTTILNMHNGGHYAMGSDGNFASGEIWTKVYGPYLIYCNAITNTLTATNAAAQALYNDAIAQAAAEETVWPYAWFTNANYAPATNRGCVTGKLVIADAGNPNASAGGMWVGLVQQPATSTGVYDFQEWAKPYQFWVKADATGNFSLPNVIAGSNYTLYAFGPGAAGTFLSQNQTGGNPPLLYDLPASPFGVTVLGKSTNNLGTVTWNPARVGATVFEIGYPDRTARKFRHGDDYWVGDIGPSPTAPSPIWSKWLEYPFDFPNGLNYVVGQSRWTTDWNFIQPVVTDSQGNYNSSASTITFYLATAPTNGAQAALYLGLASDYYSAIVITVNGNNLGNASGVTGAPNNSIPTTGFYAGYGGSDTSIREGNNAAFSDERITFPASQLHVGMNTITIGMRQIGSAYFANHFMYDYLRLELTGYIPPPPASVNTFAGNNGNLVCWPATPGATSYTVLRSITAGSNYITLTNGVTGPICGNGSNNASYWDPTAVNGTTYYYAVKSVNPVGSSTNSLPSAGVTASASVSTNIPSAPSGLTVSAVSHQSITLNWNAVTNANYYSVWRSTLVNNGGGGSNVLGTIILNNSTVATSFTDLSPTDGTIYSYFVTATGWGGTSSNSAAVASRALLTAPASAPVSLVGSFVFTNITLSWNAVAGAVGYAIYRATSGNGPFTFLQSITETTYTDYSLNTNNTYFYKIVAVNSGGISANATNYVNGLQPAPASVTATGTNAQVTVAWSAATGATSYTLKRGTNSGSEATIVASGYAGTTYTNSGLANGITYYYVVSATGASGTSGNSPEASATASAAGSGTWIANASGNWSTGGNWSSNLIAFGTGATADFSTLNMISNVTVILDSARTVSGLKFGDVAGSNNWTLAGSNALTLGTTPNVNVGNSSASISTVIAGAAGLTKTGSGNLTLGGATELFTNGVNVNAGTLTLDFSATSSPATNMIPAANPLTLGGGSLILNGTNCNQTFAGTTLNAGASVIAAGNNSTVTMNAINANAGGVLEFNLAPLAVGTTANSGNNAFVGGNGSPFFAANFATFGLYDFAAASGVGAPYPVVGGNQISGFYTLASGTAGTGGNLDVTGNITGWAGQPYLTSMRFNANLGAPQTVASYSTLTLSDILVTPNVGSYNVTFNSGGFRPAGGSSNYGGPLVIWQNNPSGELILNTALGNSKTGSATYVQAGSGTVVITGNASGYTGPTYLNGGVTLIAGNGSLGSATTGAMINLNGGTMVGNGTFAMDNAGANLRPFTLLGNGGGLAAIAGNTLTVDGVIGSAAGAGPLMIGIPPNGANGNTSGLLSGTGPGTANTIATWATGTVVLTNANWYSGGTLLLGGTLNINGINALGGANYGGTIFNGGTLQYALNAAGSNGSSDLTTIGSAGITLANGGGTVDLNGNSVTYAGSIGNNGNGALTIKSSVPNGALTLLNANRYAGGTTITNATVTVNNSTGSATGTGDVTVQNGGILQGSGALAGAVNITAAGTLAPGNPLGNLTLGNNLNLTAGSKMIMQIQHSPMTNSAVLLAGSFTAGGTLLVTNSGAATLLAGDNFRLFTATTYNGSFTNVILPPLSAGLAWSKSRLLVDGSLGVVNTNSPVIRNVSFAGSTLILQGSNGTPNWSYGIMTTTNLAVSLAQWTRADTNYFDAQGNFFWTNSAPTTFPQQFFIIEVQ